MSFGFGVSDIIGVSKLTYDIVIALKDAPETFDGIKLELSSLHNALLSVVALDAHLSRISDAQRENLRIVLQNCTNGLKQFRELVLRHPSLGNKHDTKWWDRMKFAISAEQKGIAEVRGKLLIHSNCLNMILISITHIDQQLSTSGQSTSRTNVDPLTNVGRLAALPTLNLATAPSPGAAAAHTSGLPIRGAQTAQSQISAGLSVSVSSQPSPYTIYLQERKPCYGGGILPRLAVLDSYLLAPPLNVSRSPAWLLKNPYMQGLFDRFRFHSRYSYDLQTGTWQHFITCSTCGFSFLAEAVYEKLAAIFKDHVAAEHPDFDVDARRPVVQACSEDSTSLRVRKMSEISGQGAKSSAPKETVRLEGSLDDANHGSSGAYVGCKSGDPAPFVPSKIPKQRPALEGAGQASETLHAELASLRSPASVSPPGSPSAAYASPRSGMWVPESSEHGEHNPEAKAILEDIELTFASMFSVDRLPAITL